MGSYETADESYETADEPYETADESYESADEVTCPAHQPRSLFIKACPVIWPRPWLGPFQDIRVAPQQLA